MLVFYGEELIASCITPEIEDHSLLAVRGYLFDSYIHTYIHNYLLYLRLSLCVFNLRTRNAVVSFLKEK
jgi:hypothetical protein